MDNPMISIGRLIKQADISLTRQMNNLARQNNLTGNQMNIIDYLSRQENMATDQQAIEHEFNIRRSTTTIILQRMEKRGLVQRITDPHDRRRRQVQLTAIARELVPVVKDYIRKQEGLLTSQFSPAELIITARVLKYIKEAN
ncbi:MAG: MarR family winged helix-turn-helix transcriptional regulator [Limosilactobacillus pontis]|uniref:MarR family transcriptional regulator n=1 Tax=Limosilactobacillus pontis TaxID=35787 RepID=A0A2J6NMD2_9LACO|nr:MarR family transcriptional regulator [Limosilactobacillus pontis]PMB82480.1 MarR family transcriptional regulator [Limosilactobacillus pontis]